MITNGHSCGQYGVAPVIQPVQFGAPVTFLLAIFSYPSRKFLVLCVRISLIQKEMPFSVTCGGFPIPLQDLREELLLVEASPLFYFLALVLVIIIQEVP